MNKQFCIDALNEALERYERPKIFNSDQGSQFTNNEFQNILSANKIKVLIDSKGRAINIYLERYFSTLV